MADDLKEVRQSSVPFDMNAPVVIEFGPNMPEVKQANCGIKGCQWVKEKSKDGTAGGFCEKKAMNGNKYCSSHMDLAESRGMEITRVVAELEQLTGDKLKNALDSLIPKGGVKLPVPVEPESESEEEFIPSKCHCNPYAQGPCNYCERREKRKNGEEVSDSEEEEPKKEEQVYFAENIGMGMKPMSKELVEKYNEVHKSNPAFEPIYIELKIGNRKARIFID